LSQEKQKQVQEWKQKLSKLGIQYHQNLTEENTELTFAREELTGLTEDFISGLHTAKDGKMKVHIFHLSNLAVTHEHENEGSTHLSCCFSYFKYVLQCQNSQSS
jgi:Zn-dependent oligopeptidase